MRNEFLEAPGDGSDEDVEACSSADELEKGVGSASNKRRRTGSYSGSDDDGGDFGGFSDDEERSNEEKGTVKELHTDENARPEKSETDNPMRRAALELPAVPKPLTKKNLVATEKAIKKSGVVYLSRIPPFMKPTKLRSLLEPYGKINRIFLAPEDPLSRNRRVRNGGNKKKTYTEGWVEFVDKKRAKEACELLNTQTIGGRKGTYYRDDIWSLIYLKGFKWHNLTEQVASENASRAARMRAEISKATKENKEFVANVERAKMLDGMEAKAAAKRKRSGVLDWDDGAETGADAEMKTGFVRNRQRKFQQIPLAKRRKQENEKKEQPDRIQRVLSKIF